MSVTDCSWRNYSSHPRILRMLLLLFIFFHLTDVCNCFQGSQKHLRFHYCVHVLGTAVEIRRVAGVDLQKFVSAPSGLKLMKSCCVVARLGLETAFSHAQSSLHWPDEAVSRFSSCLPPVDVQALSGRTELIRSLCSWPVPCKMSRFVILPVSQTFSFFCFQGKHWGGFVEGSSVGNAAYNLQFQLEKPSIVWDQLNWILNLFFRLLAHLWHIS